MKKHGHYCHVCGKHRANEKFSGKGHVKHICKDCDREHRAAIRARKKEFDSRVVFVQVLARPDRKLVLKRGGAANDFFAYRKEVGCEAWDELKAIPGALGEPIGLWLPPAGGVSAYAQGVEVSARYDGPVPEECEIIALPACWMMVFQGPPFDKGRVGEAVGVVQKAIRNSIRNCTATNGRTTTRRVCTGSRFASADTLRRDRCDRASALAYCIGYSAPIHSYA